MAGHVTVTPVYWSPSGFQYTPSYKTVVNGYLRNLASDSGHPTNVSSVATQYYQQSNATGAPIQHVQYSVQAAAEVDDSDAYPAEGGTTGCTPAGGFSACVVDSSMQAELENQLTAMKLPMDDSHLYLILFPSGVDTCQSAGNATSGDLCSSNTYCAYHNAVAAGTSYLLYTDEPFPDLAGCADPFIGAQAPNGDSYADDQISLLSHELNETVTDWSGAWIDTAGYEDGDECAYVYGSPLGSTGVTTDSSARGTAYNQVIGSGKYYTQDEFSNEDYALGRGDPDTTGGTLVPGCIQREELPQASFTWAGTVVAGTSATFNASASVDPDDAAPLAYSWNWGDGTPNSSGSNTSHTFAAAGTYNVNLTVTDAGGWSASVPKAVTVIAVAPAACSPSGIPVVGDFNGMGKDQLAFVGQSGSCILQPSGSPSAVSWSTGLFYGTKATLTGDVNGDGKADLVAVDSSSTWVMTSTGTSFSTAASWSGTPFYGTRATFLADVSGDGKADLVAVDDSSTWVMLSTGSGFSAPTPWSTVPFYGSVKTLAGDVNGDGKADLIAVNSSSTWVTKSNGTGFDAPTLWSNVPFYGNVGTLVGDLNGDGKADLVAVNSSSIWVMASGSTAFNAPARWSSVPFYGNVATLIGDLNGDRAADLIAVNSASVWAMTSTVTTFSAPVLWPT